LVELSFGLDFLSSFVPSDLDFMPCLVSCSLCFSSPFFSACLPQYTG
jgi:hypothetical protein